MKDTILQLQIAIDGKDIQSLIPPFSARECIQILTPISQGVLRRTVNGDLLCVSGGGHKKFHSLIQCKDKAPPAFSAIWKGVVLKVSCIQSMTQTVPKGSADVQVDRDLSDPHLFDSFGKEWPLQPPKNRWISIPQDFPGGFITFRPILSMMVKNYEVETNEWGLSVGWTLELEEI